MNQDRIEFAAKALSPFVWDPNSAQSAGDPHAVQLQRERTIRRVIRVMEALDEYDRLHAGQTSAP